jgi:hypothetical protein
VSFGITWLRGEAKLESGDANIVVFCRERFIAVIEFGSPRVWVRTAILKARQKAPRRSRLW